jgi:hypothetical protein
MTEARVTAWIPIRKMLHIHPKVPDDFHDCLDALRIALPQVLKKLCWTEIDATVCQQTPSKKIARDILLLNQTSILGVQHVEFLKVCCFVRYDVEAMRARNPERDISLPFLQGVAACEVAAWLEEALMLAQLAYPARIKSGAGRTYVGPHAMNVIGAISGLPYEAVFSDELSWPTVEIVPIECVAQWQSQLGLFSQGVARTPVQRAMASFTHLGADLGGQGGETLFWAMQGLEAFYCRGKDKLRHQLAQGSRHFLGEWEDQRNIVGHLYDFRSKFVHGSFNLDCWNNSCDPQDEDWADLQNFELAVGLAARMLLSTLQRCIRKQILQVEFDGSKP